MGMSKPLECPPIPITAQMDPTHDTAVLALGWFWHPQQAYQQIDGIEQVIVGYTGGEQKNPTYQNIKDATEAVLIEYDPSIITYKQILDEWADQHHPFSMQSTQYRSAIFVKNDQERMVAEGVLKELFTRDGRKVFTDVEDATTFYKGEEYHQDFLNKQKSSRAFYPY